MIANEDSMKVYVIQRKNGIMMNIRVNAKNLIISVLVKMVICEILAHVIACVIRHVKWTSVCSCEKRLYVKLVLAYEDEILNTIETSLDYEKVTCEKNNCLTCAISLLIICLLLLVVISSSCYYYNTLYKNGKRIMVFNTK